MNPSGENSEKFILYLDADPASAAKSLKIIDDTRAKLAAAAKAAEGIGEAAARGTNRADAELADLAAKADSAATRVRGIADQAAGVDRLAGSFDRAAASASKVQASGGFDLNKVQSVAGAAGGVASLVGGSAATSAVSSTVALTAQLGAFGLAMGAGAVVLKAVTDEQNKATEAAKNYTEALAGASSATSKDIQRTIDDLQGQKQALQEGRAALQSYADGFDLAQSEFAAGIIDSREEFDNTIQYLNEGLYDLTGGAIGLKNGMGSAVFTASNMESVLNENQSAINALNGKIATNTALLTTDTVKRNDEAAALQKQVDAQIEAADRTIAIDNMTREAREKLIGEHEREIAIIDDLIRNTDLSTDAAEQLSVRSGELAVDIRELESVTYSYADALHAEEAAKDALKDQSDALNDGLKDVQAAEKAVQDASERTTEARRSLADAEDEHAARIVKLQDDAADKEREAGAKAAEDRQAAEDKAAADRRQQFEAHLKRIADIEKQYTRSHAEAVGNRDADAARQAETTRKDALDAENDANAERLKAIDDALREQNKAVDKRLAEQLAAIQKNARESIAAENDSYAKRQRQLQEALDKAVAAEQFANNRLEAERNLNAFRAQYWAGVVETANKRMADSAAALAASVTASAGIISGAAGAAQGSSAFPPLSDANGNIIPYSGGGGGGGGGLFTSAYAMPFGGAFDYPHAPSAVGRKPPSAPSDVTLNFKIDNYSDVARVGNTVLQVVGALYGGRR